MVEFCFCELNTDKNKLVIKLLKYTTMTIRTFWTILLKVVGLYIVFGSLYVVPQFVGTFYSLDYDNWDARLLTAIGLAIISIGIYMLTLRVFIFRTSWLIDNLHLDKGFLEDRIDLNISSSAILAIAVIVVGGLMFVESLPRFCSQVFAYLKAENTFRDESTSSDPILFYMLKTLVGYLLMTNSKYVVNFINKYSEGEKSITD
jgi:hypothetical protein